MRRTASGPWRKLGADVRYRLEARWETFVCTGRGVRKRPVMFLELEIRPASSGRGWKRMTKIPAWLYVALKAEG